MSKYNPLKTLLKSRQVNGTFEKSLHINQKNVQKVLLKKCLRHYEWFSEKAYKYVHNRFRWFMKTHHSYEYLNKEYVITHVSYDSFYSNVLFINYVIGDKEYIYRCDLKYLDL